jgi:hypothetical protein
MNDPRGKVQRWKVYDVTEREHVIDAYEATVSNDGDLIFKIYDADFDVYDGTITFSRMRWATLVPQLWKPHGDENGGNDG